ncbi:MAG: hypothetical protein K0Q55_2959 [Verrucomicrobia bacterium]|jgi:hypothetical protein|nr:hypothetical protein [Verrucomicrobiota bacterium]
MANKKLDQLILQLENYIEVWKQFNNYIALARSKKFQPEDENQFLEIKSVIAQELEMILSVIESGTPTKEDVHGLIGSAPSIRYMSELPEGSLRAIENQWHKSFISWQSILGQLKVQQRAEEGKGFFSMFGKK